MERKICPKCNLQGSQEWLDEHERVGCKPKSAPKRAKTFSDKDADYAPAK